MADLTAAWSQYLVKGPNAVMHGGLVDGHCKEVFEISSFKVLLSTALEIIPSLFNVQIHTYNKEWMISKALDSFIMMRKQGTEFNIVMYGGNIAIYSTITLLQRESKVTYSGLVNPYCKDVIGNIVTLSRLDARCKAGMDEKSSSPFD
ncbi:hypothetical protein Goshw_015257, partial [Gossypium schwendimanii]|nr:hypothetical protein [Gossypium schwendimanii]